MLVAGKSPSHPPSRSLNPTVACLSQWYETHTIQHELRRQAAQARRAQAGKVGKTYVTAHKAAVCKRMRAKTEKDAADPFCSSSRRVRREDPRNVRPAFLVAERSINLCVCETRKSLLQELVSIFVHIPPCHRRSTGSKTN